MMLPILISVSVAPVSYFFCANALLLVAASSARAAARAPSRKLIMGILISLGSRWMCHLLFDWSAWRLLVALNTLQPRPATKSPPRRRRGGRYLVGCRGQLPAGRNIN